MGPPPWQGHLKNSYRKKLKLKNWIAKNCKIHETKVPTYIPGVLFPFPAVSRANKLTL